MRPSESVRVRKDDIEWLDKLRGALARIHDKPWTRTKTISWLCEVSGIKIHEPLPWLCGRCLRPIFWPVKTRLMLGRPSTCPHCGARHILAKAGEVPIDVFARINAHFGDTMRTGRENDPKVSHRPAVSDQLSHTLQARMKAGEEFELWFVW